MDGTCQAPLSMGFPSKNTGVPFPSLMDLSDPGIQPMSLVDLSDPGIQPMSLVDLSDPGIQPMSLVDRSDPGIQPMSLASLALQADQLKRRLFGGSTKHNSWVTLKPPSHPSWQDAPGAS